MDMNEILDFGESAVTDVETKLNILKFNYNWCDAVEEHEKQIEDQRQCADIERELKKLMSGKMNKNDIKNNGDFVVREETQVLDLGNTPVTDWTEKLEIPKSDYASFDGVKEEERKIKNLQRCAEIEKEIKKLLFGKKINDDMADSGELITSEDTPVLDFKNKPVKNLKEKLEILKFDNSLADRVEREEKTDEKTKPVDKAISKKTDKIVKKQTKEETNEDFDIFRESPGQANKKGQQNKTKVNDKEQIQWDPHTFVSKVHEENPEIPKLQPVATNDDEGKMEKLEMLKFDNSLADRVEEEEKTDEKTKPVDKAINKKTEKIIKKQNKEETNEDFDIFRESLDQANKKGQQNKTQVNDKEQIQRDPQTFVSKVHEENPEIPKLQPVATNDDEGKREKLKMLKFDKSLADRVEGKEKTDEKTKPVDKAINKKTEKIVKKQNKEETNEDFDILRK